jgi:hypothetical protein
MLKALISSYFPAPTAPPHQAAPESVRPRVRGVLAPSALESLGAKVRGERRTHAPLPPRSASPLPTFPHEALVRVANAASADTRLTMLGVNTAWHDATVEAAALANPTAHVTAPAEFILAVHAVRARHLKTIKIYASFSAKQLTTMLAALPDNLEGLDLNGCHRLTNQHLKTALQGKSQLRTLHLTWCTNLTDAGVQAALQNKHLLHTLTLSGCWRLTDAGMQAALHDKPLLHTLNLSGCEGVSQALRTELRNRGIEVLG